MESEPATVASLQPRRRRTPALTLLALVASAAGALAVLALGLLLLAR